MQTCPRCGALNRINARFCSKCGNVLTSASAGITGLLSPNTLLQNRYVILKKIGQGGMGAVYQAQDSYLPSKLWAIKELASAQITDPAERASAVAAFRQEGELLATLDHINLPRVIQLFEENDKQYLVMDFVDGRPLDQIAAATSGFLPENTVLQWMDQLCDVLGYLHAHQPPIIFRDLKPANIMLTPDGRIKLIDFGIARFFKHGKTKDTALFGTVGFAAPEQFGTGQTDARSDVYSLGVTLHNLLTKYDPAQSPFNLPLARTLNSQVSPQTEAVIVRATQSVPDQRFQSASQMKQALHGANLSVDKVPLPSPFVFRSGGQARTVPELVRLCDAHPNDAMWHLTNGHFESWLLSMGQPALAQAATSARQNATAPQALARFLDATGLPHTYAGVAQPSKPMIPPAAPPARVQTPSARRPSSAWKWALGLGVVGALCLVCMLLVLGVSYLNSPSPATQPTIIVVVVPTVAPTAVPTTAPTVVPTAARTATSAVADAWVQFYVDLKNGPATSFDTIATLTHDQQLKIIGRDNTPDSDWILVRDESNRQGWVRASQVNLNVSLSGFPYTQGPATPTPRPTAIPSRTPTWTATPTPKTCPPNPALVQINNFLEVDLTISLVGPINADVHIPSNGSIKICMPQGSYSYTSYAIGYNPIINTKMFTRDSMTDCTHWDWWPASDLSRVGTCSTIESEYYPP